MSGKLTRDRASAQAREMLMRLESDSERHPELQTTAFEWQGALHLGRLHRPYPEKPYIVYIVKQPGPVPTSIASALRRMGTVPVIKVSPRVEFAGSRYLLGLSGDTLCVLSGEDILYCHVHPRDPSDGSFQTGAELVGFDNP